MHENRAIKFVGALGILLFVTNCGMVPSGGSSSDSSHSLSTDQPNFNISATLVLGQVNFSSRIANAGAYSGSTNAVGLDRPMGVAIDRSVMPNRVYVADFGNNRVLGWASVDSLYNGVAADKVIGQSNFTSHFSNRNQANPGNNTISNVYGLEVDDAGNLYVADRGNSRVLVFLTPYVQTAVAGSGDSIADRVIGQDTFTSGSCSNPSYLYASAASLCLPADVAVDAMGNVFVADSANNRVVEYNAFLASDRFADRVFGQSDTSSIKPGKGKGGLNFPVDIAVDSAGNVYVADQGNQRILEYNTALTTDTIADRVYGQKDFNSNFVNRTGQFNVTDAQSLSYPEGVAVDVFGNMYSAETGNSRVLEFKNPLSSAVADFVYGQPDFSSLGCNTGGSGKPNNHNLCSARDVAIDSHGNVWVADKTNNRVIRFGNAGGPTLPPTVLPPTGLDGTAGDGSVALHWTPSASPGAVAQHLYRSTTSGGPYSLIATFGDNTTNIYTDSTVTNGTAYYYVVTASDFADEESPNSNEIVVTPGVPPPSILPPTGLHSTAGDGVVMLDWMPSASPGAVAQHLYRSTTSGGPYSLIATFGDNTTNTYTDSNVTNGTAYYYVVTASGSANEDSIKSNEVVATPGVSPPPPSEVTIPSESFHFEEGPGDKCWLQNEVEFSFEKVPGDITSGDAGHTTNDIVESTTVVNMIFPDGSKAKGKFETKEDHGSNPDSPYNYVLEYEVTFDCYTMKSHVSVGQEVTIQASGTLSDGHTFFGTGMVLTHH
jgi:sugar lactone lactonase YvrE